MKREESSHVGMTRDMRTMNAEKHKEMDDAFDAAYDLLRKNPMVREVVVGCEDRGPWFVCTQEFPSWVKR